MMRLVVYTQYREDYGTRWKNKGGFEYLAGRFTYAELAADPKTIERALTEARRLIDYRGRGSEEYVIDWELLDRHECTETQKDEAEWEGYTRLLRNLPARSAQETVDEVEKTPLAA